MVLCVDKTHVTGTFQYYNFFFVPESKICYTSIRRVLLHMNKDRVCEHRLTHLTQVNTLNSLSTPSTNKDIHIEPSSPLELHPPIL